LVDNDEELSRLQERLEMIHAEFFDEYDRRRASLGGRVSALRGERAPPKDKGVDLHLVPDVKQIIPAIKKKVLEGVVLVFSGVLPLGTDTLNADISLWARGFGATIAQKINSKTTHLVAGRNRTAKVREATRYLTISIVTIQWLLDSLVHWKRMDEEPYLLPVHPEDRGEPVGSGRSSPSKREKPDDPNMLSSEDETSSISDGESEGVGSQQNTDELDAEILQSSGLNEHSPIGYDAAEQAEVHDELKAFLGSDDEDTESDSDLSLPDTGQQTRKRKRDTESDSDAESDRSSGKGSDPAADGLGSRLSRKIRRSHARSTGLKAVATLSPGDPGSENSLIEPSSDMPESEREAADEDIGDYDEGEEEDEEDEEEGEGEDAAALEREMLAAFEDGSWDQGEMEDEGPT
jgi:RNA polymerase II subunit A-like phosphatase